MAFKVPSVWRLRKAVLLPTLAATATNFPVFFPVLPKGRAEALVAVIIGAPKPTVLVLTGGGIQERDNRIQAVSCPAVGEHEWASVANQL
jgi:hypothetical protein